MIPEEDHSLEDITGESQGILEIFQGICDHIRDIEMIEERMRIGVNQEREVVIEI